MNIAITIKQLRGGQYEGTVEGGLFCTRMNRQMSSRRRTSRKTLEAILGRNFRPGRHVLSIEKASRIFLIDDCDRPGGLRKE